MPHIELAELHTVVDRVNAVGDAHHHAGPRPESALVTSYVIIPLTIHRINFDAFPEKRYRLPYSFGSFEQRSHAVFSRKQAGNLSRPPRVSLLRDGRRGEPAHGLHGGAPSYMAGRSWTMA